jgi:DtxR family Mn-dependent transcriptional regulator
MSKVLSQSIEDYLKAIYSLQSNGKASISEIAASLDVAASSATKMVQRLSLLELVSHSSHKDVSLTPHGLKVTMKVIRRHRLLETFLVEIMGYTWDEVHDEADNLEHYISTKFENKMVELLNNPLFDPHGDPIPNENGEILTLEDTQLMLVPPNTEVTIVRINKDDTDLLLYLTKIGVVINAKIKVMEKQEFGGSIIFILNGESRMIGLEAAKYVYVKES